jgi:glycosyltransferase involved in cell wall biosynthesis
MKRLAFVIQRYGREVNGGAEELCRQVAERLAVKFDLDILTTCARDYLRWENYYPAGEGQLDGVRVIRFRVVRERKVRAFGRFSQKIYGRPHTFTQEAEWMERQGPTAPELFEHLRTHRRKYDLFVFFTYLYAPTFFGLPLVAERSLLVPMAHDEPPLHLGLFRPLFHLPRGLIFNTDQERRFVHRTFRNDYLPWIVGGTGIELPPLPEPPPPAGDYLLYLGRVDVEKGCAELAESFRRYKKEHPSSLRLLLAGEINLKLPRDPDLVTPGFISPERKAELLAGARAVVVPSRRESLSLAALEAWAAGKPVLAHRGSPVLVDHLERSGGGRLYGDFEEFSRGLEALTSGGEEGRRRGLDGRRYVAENYNWRQTLTAYHDFLVRMASRVGEEGANRG